MEVYKHKILVTGACGQIGTELVAALRARHGWVNVIAADIHDATDKMQKDGLYVKLDVLNKKKLTYMITHLGIKEIYHLAAVLSASGEQNPAKAWDINMLGLLNVLEAARGRKSCRVFWPSSIAVFGPGSHKAACPQSSLPDPTTVYGISKLAGEQWCKYYRDKFGLDVRSIRYPGLISYTAKPGGGTTDYAVDIFHHALEAGHYTCFLREGTGLPMLYMTDAVRAALELMAAPLPALSVHTSYNLAGMNFTPKELAAAIRQHLPDFEISYAPDFRQQIADSWPSSIDDRHARHDWGWQPQYDLTQMVTEMLTALSAKEYV
jgi:nucleoside-diphosphate-sugar epimerase